MKNAILAYGRCDQNIYNQIFKQTQKEYPVLFSTQTTMHVFDFLLKVPKQSSENIAPKI